MKKHLHLRILSLFLAAVLIAGSLPCPVFADPLSSDIELPLIPVGAAADETPDGSADETPDGSDDELPAIPVGTAADENPDDPADEKPDETEEPADDPGEIPPEETSIADGLYLIESALSPDLVLEIRDDSLANKGNAALGKKTGDYRQAFYIASCGEGIYTVRNYYSGLVLDVAGGLSKNGTNIQQYAANGSAAQQWKIEKNADGTLTFTCARNGKAMDVAGAKKAAGTNVQIYTANGTAAQSWRLAELCGVTKMFEELEESGLEDGYYRILSGKNSAMCLGIEGGSRALTANAALYKRDGGSGEIFRVTNLGGGLYRITATRSGMVLDLQGGLTKNGTNIRQYTSNGTAAQQWYIKKDPATGNCAILSAKNMKTAADLAGGLTSAGTNVRAYRFNGTAAQLWRFEKTDIANIGDKIEEGVFRILPASDPSKALTIAGAGLANGANAELGNYRAGNEQMFSFSENADGTWTIRNVNSGKVLDIAGGSRRSGANIQQYDGNGTVAQKIALVPTGREDNSCTLLVYGTMAFDVAGGKIAAGTNVRLYTPNGTAAQAFILEKATPLDGYVYDAEGRRWYQQNGVKSVGWGTVNGRRTLLTFLHNALVPAGRTLYIWGGGWGGLGTDSTSDSAKIGYQPGWQSFYDTHATPSYDHSNYRWRYGSGLDCSGFVAWAVYNTMYTADNLEDLVVQSTSVAPTYIRRGWAHQDMSAYRPGDVVSMSGHVWISLGRCSDGTILLVHSSPKGVQLSGTGGKSVQLAAKYMKILAPNWPYAIRTVDYPSQTTSKATWNVNGSGLFTDPEGIQKMSAEDVMRTLFGS